MKFLFLILALINSGWGQFLPFPIEYHYNYSGRIATGIPSIRNQVSATGIIAHLIVQMKSEITGLVKIQDVKVGTFNDHVDSNKHLREELPMSYHPLDSEIASKLEQPFGVNFAEEKEHVMIVPKSDNEFMTNLRKSIAGILRIQPILKKIDDDGPFPIIKVFGFEEDSIFGRCENQYTITQLHPYTMTREDPEDETNARLKVEPSLTNRMILGDKQWRLVKTVDFDRCHDRVMLMHSGTANISEAGNGQSNSLSARSSVSTYFLRGSNSTLKIMKAYVEGSIALNPFGHKQQMLQAITNQTLTLLDIKSSNLTKIRLPKPTRYIQTWNYEVASPFSPPAEEPKPWVNYYNKTNKLEPVPALGYLLQYPEKTYNYSVFRDEILSHLETIVDKMDQIPNVANMSAPFPANLTGHEVLLHMEHASKLIRYLTDEEINAIFEAAQLQTDTKGQKRLMYLIDILAASGAAPPMKVLLDKIKSGNITNARAASIFMTLTNHLVSPVIVPELMDYAMTMDVEQNPFLTSAVLTNFATMARRICISEDYKNYSVPNPVFGNEACQSNSIVAIFLAHLVAKVESLTKDWQKAIYVEALSNLGTPSAMEVLQVFITREIMFPLKVKLLAISAMARNKMPDSVRDEVFDVLMDVVSNMNYTDEIRQASIVTLLSWHPEASWWQRMAKQTWQESSQSIASFIALTAQGLSLSTDPHLKEQADIAAFVLPLMKPVSPSFKNSFDYLFSKYDPISRIIFNSKFSTFKDLRSKNSSSEVHLKLQSSSGGFDLNLLELSAFLNAPLQDKLRESLKFADHISLENLELESIFASLPSDSFSGVMNENLLLEEPESLLRIKFLDHITSFLPLNAEALQNLGGEGKQTLEELVEIILNEQELSTLKYLNPLDIEYFIPTELGLPLVGSISLPMLIVSKGSAKLQLDGSPATKDSIENILQHNLYQLSVNSNFRLVSKLVSRMKVLIPWEASYIEAGVDNYKESNLPFTGNFTLSKATEDKFDFYWAPLTPNAFPLFYAHNFPYTLLRPYNASFGSKGDFKLILADEESKPLIKKNQTIPLAEAFGQNITLEYQADESYPFTKYRFIEYCRKPELILELLSSPTSKYWQMSLNHHSNQSHFRPARISVTYSPELPVLLKGNLKRKNYLNKLSPSMKSDLFCANDTTCSDSIKQMKRLKSGTLVLAFVADLFKDGSNEQYKHSFMFVLTKPASSSHYEGQEMATIPMTTYQSSIGLLGFHGPGMPTSIYGWETIFQVPRVKNLAFLTEELRLGLMTSAKGEVTYVETVNDFRPPPVIIAFEGQMTISSERRDMLLYELNNLCSKVDSLSDLQTAVIYDSVNMDIDFEWDSFPKDLQNLTYSVGKFLEGLVWPHGEYNTLDIPNQPFKMSVTGNRSLSSPAYSFWIKKPEENVFISEVPIPDYMTSVVPVKGFEGPNNTIKLGQPLTNNMCAILLYEKLITSFDGLTYPYIPVPCWTITTHDIEHKFVIYTNKDHHTGMHQAQIVIPNENIAVQVDKFGVKVNGTSVSLGWYDTDIYGTSGTVVMKVKKVLNGSQAYIPGKMLVVSMLGLYITPDPSIKKNIRGVCGNFDGNPSNDLVGPKTCIYEDIELFKFAWTIPSGDHCEESDIDVESNLVRRFQRNCTKDDGPPTNPMGTTTLSNAASELACILMIYPIQRAPSGDGLCVTLGSYPTCQPLCDADGTGDDTTGGQGKCWSSKSIPSEVKNAIDVGYLLNPVKVAGEYLTDMMVIIHTKCYPK